MTDLLLTWTNTQVTSVSRFTCAGIAYKRNEPVAFRDSYRQVCFGLGTLAND